MPRAARDLLGLGELQHRVDRSGPARCSCVAWSISNLTRSVSMRRTSGSSRSTILRLVVTMMSESGTLRAARTPGRPGGDGPPSAGRADAGTSRRSGTACQGLARRAGGSGAVRVTTGLAGDVASSGRGALPRPPRSATSGAASHVVDIAARRTPVPEAPRALRLAGGSGCGGRCGVRPAVCGASSASRARPRRRARLAFTAGSIVTSSMGCSALPSPASVSCGASSRNERARCLSPLRSSVVRAPAPGDDAGR